MHYAINYVRGVLMGSRVAGFHAAALVHGHIHDYRSFPHQLKHIPGHQFGRFGAYHQDCSDQQVGARQQFSHAYRVGIECGDIIGHDVVKVAQAIDIHVEYVNVGPHPGGNFGGVGAHHSSTDDGDSGRFHTRYSPQQDASASPAGLQHLGPLLNRHASGHLRHGRQQGQIAIIKLHRLISYGRGAGVPEDLGELPLSGEMKIGEYHLPHPDQMQFRRLGLLDFYDHLGG